MQTSSPVTDVLARIGRIQSHFAPAGATPPMRVLPSADFEPFGDAYQRAVAASSPPAPQATTEVQQVATRLVPEQMVAFRADPRPVIWSSPSPGIGVGATQRIGGYGPMPVPTDLAPLGNGRIPTDRLQPISQPGHRLYAPAAAAWDGLVAAAAAQGVEVRITDSYRPYEEQVDLAARKGLYKNGGLAATPGTSNHGWGLAVDADVTDQTVLTWMRENGPRFGFVEAVPREPWHWEYRPEQV